MRSPLGRWLFVLGNIILAAPIALSLIHSVSSYNIMDKSLHISLGRKGAEIVKYSPVQIKQSGVDGLRMYDAGTPNKAIEHAVVLDDDYRSITFPPIEHLAFYEEGATGEGIDEIAIDLWLPSMPKDPSDFRAWAAYDEAIRNLVQETIDRINAAH